MAGRSISAAVTAVAVLLLAAGAADARPCKTIFLSYTVSTFRLPAADLPQDPFLLYRLDQPRFTIVAEPDPDSYSDSDILPLPLRFPATTTAAVTADDDEKALPFSLRRLGGGLTGGFGSLRDRTMDILYVVVALLLGVGCGLLTSAAVYLMWSFVAYGRRGVDDSDDEEYERLGGDGYVKILDDPVKKGYEGN